MASVRNLGCGQLAMLAALGLFAGAATPAQAADLGGDCCADLEERIAELEATTVRKGNRKVKLEVSGHVNEAIMIWDDGDEQNAYVVTNDNARTRFRFKGEAKIDADWKAGYLLEIGLRTAHSGRFTQDDDSGDGAGLLDIRHSVWYLDNKSYGRLWVGLTGGASEGITEINQAATKDVLKYSDPEDTGLGLFLKSDGVTLGTGSGATATGFQWRRLLRDNGNQPGEGRRYNLVRYDTPELMGFTGTAAWGEDDTWDVGIRYKGEFGDFKLAAGIAYGENTDGTGQTGFQCVGNISSTGAGDRDCEQLGGSASVMHSPSGIYVNFAAGYLEDNFIEGDTGVLVPVAARDDRHTFYAGEIGIEQKWNSLGKTTIFGQYFMNEGGTQDRDVRLGIGGVNQGDVQDSELESFGVGIVQGIDAAAMHVYLTYRHYEGEVTANNAGVVTDFDLDDLDVVMGGAIIRF
ncbi:MAG: porin [Hyphomicrobium sp.]